MIKLLVYLIVLIMLGLAACSLLGYLGYEQIRTPVHHSKSSNVIVVERGESTDSVLSRLESLGIIQNKLVVKAYIKLSGNSSSIKAGDYKFPSPITPIQALKILSTGSREHEKFTVIEGSTIFDIAENLQKTPALKVSSKSEAMSLLKNVELIKDFDPAAKTLEGYLFPDTYFIQKETTAKQLVSNMVKRFRAVWEKDLKKDALRNNLSVHKTVTIGSIIETEAKLSSERPIVASVIYNRLGKGMRLSVDSTIVYASKLSGKWRGNGKVYMSDIKRKSPYNTRLYKGLPPGPVGNPGLSSMKAALNPGDTNYIYYVRDPDFVNGKHNFYSTSKEFEQGVKKLRAWERAQKKSK